MNYLLDTCVISELIKKEPDSNVQEWINSQYHWQLFISVITLGELISGINRLPDSRKRKNLESWFEDSVLKKFEKLTIPVSREIAVRWGILQSELIKKGKTIPIIDGLIVSTAIINDLVLVTRNTSDFINTGCELFNPWEK